MEEGRPASTEQGCSALLGGARGRSGAEWALRGRGCVVGCSSVCVRVGTLCDSFAAW